MADPDADRRGRRAIRIAQLLLALAAVGLWGASRLPWVRIRSFDGLGQPKTVTLSGAAWSTALLPVAAVLLAAAVAALAVRGWLLRLLAMVVAAASLAIGYLAISLWVMPDVALRGADLAGVPVISLVGSERHHVGAAITVAAAAITLIGAALLMRAAASVSAATTNYVAPGARRAMAEHNGDPQMSERTLWDALDEGRDPTDAAAETTESEAPDSDSKGR